MSAFNPFRARVADGAATTTPAAASATFPDFPDSTFLPPEQLSAESPSKPLESAASQISSDYPKNPSLSSEIEKDDTASSDEQSADPFNPDSPASDDDDDLDDLDKENQSSAISRVPGNRSEVPSGSTPHLAPSTGRASIASPSTASLSREYNVQTTPETNTSNAPTISQSLDRPTDQVPSEHNTNLNAPGRAVREKKPPPPPKSHHGKRISITPNPGSIPEPPPARSSKRFSYNSLPAENAASRTTGTPNVTSVAQAASGENSQSYSDNPIATESSESLSRTRSQNRRPPTPPLSRRQSQMHRSKSTQSKSSASHLTISSVDSESNDGGSQPPSPGPSTKSKGPSSSQNGKRISMPPPSSGDLRPSVTSTGATENLSSLSSRSGTSPNRRSSSYGSLGAGSSAPPPPPPARRRGRDSMIRVQSSDGASGAQSTLPEPEQLPQPSNAQDILADLTRLQKEVDDLRGHYEGRKVSQ